MSRSSWTRKHRSDTLKQETLKERNEKTEKNEKHEKKHKKKKKEKRTEKLQEEQDATAPWLNIAGIQKFMACELSRNRGQDHTSIKGTEITESKRIKR